MPTCAPGLLKAGLEKAKEPFSGPDASSDTSHMSSEPTLVSMPRCPGLLLIPGTAKADDDQDEEEEEEEAAAAPEEAAAAPEAPPTIVVVVVGSAAVAPVAVVAAVTSGGSFSLCCRWTFSGTALKLEYGDGEKEGRGGDLEEPTVEPPILASAENEADEEEAEDDDDDDEDEEEAGSSLALPGFSEDASTPARDCCRRLV